MVTRRMLLWGAGAAFCGGALGRVGVPAVPAALSVVPAGPPAGLARTPAAAPWWILDGRLDRAHEYAAAARAAGMPVARFDDDIGHLAMRFDTLWSVGPAAAAGATLESGFFILRQLAERRGMSVVFTALHRHDRGVCRHEVLYAASSSLGDAAVAALSQPAWRAPLCAVLLRGPGQPAPEPPAPAVLGERERHAACGRESWDGPARHLSWAMMPAARRAS